MPGKKSAQVLGFMNWLREKLAELLLAATLTVLAFVIDPLRLGGTVPSYLQGLVYIFLAFISVLICWDFRNRAQRKYGVSKANCFALMLIVILWSGAYWCSLRLQEDGQGNGEGATEVATPTPTKEETAFGVVEDYYDFIGSKMYDEAEALLDPDLLVVFGGRAAWENEGEAFSYFLPSTDAISVKRNGNVYQIWIDGLIRTRIGATSSPPEFYTYCIVSMPDEEQDWQIRDLHDSKETCW